MKARRMRLIAFLYERVPGFSSGGVARTEVISLRRPVYPSIPVISCARSPSSISGTLVVMPEI